MRPTLTVRKKFFLIKPFLLFHENKGVNKDQPGEKRSQMRFEQNPDLESSELEVYEEVLRQIA